MNVQVSPNFKKVAFKAMLSIAAFILVYIVLILLGAGLTVFCIIGAFYLISARPMVITFGLGIGLVGLGFFILAFLIKFLFKKHKINMSHLNEIFESEEPELFNFIKNIVLEVETKFPHKVFLSNDVNASVFYNSSFWSMFLPIRKNLQIGIGLINAVTEQELKAILAHEFGHFSQRSMKIGSYVYNVNQIIYNMLYDNDAYENMIQSWANVSGYFSLFVIPAVKIISGIQWVLKKMYDFVNLRYLALSREMEFHADEVAANVAGSNALKDALLRLDLAEYSFNETLSFYQSKLEQNLKSNNIYKEQLSVMNFIASKKRLPFKNNFPLVTLNEIKKYNRSKLNIKDQWASHPSTEDRIEALERLNIDKHILEDNPSILLFSNMLKVQEKITNELFANLDYKESPVVLTEDTFKKEYETMFLKNSFPEEYNGYYDNKNPSIINLEDTISLINDSTTMTELFSEKMVNFTYEYNSIKEDLEVLNLIDQNKLTVNSFDYNGQKFNCKAASTVIQTIQKELLSIEPIIQQNDLKIYQYFYNKAFKKNNQNLLTEKYSNFYNFTSDFEKKRILVNDLNSAIQFISVTTPLNEIERNFKSIYTMEINLKNEIKLLMNDAALNGELMVQCIDNFNLYLPNDLDYFKYETYNDYNLNIFLMALNDFNYLINRKYFLLKSDLLKFQIEQN